MGNYRSFDNKVARAVFIGLLIACGFSLVIFFPDFFLLLFAAVFLAVLLTFSAKWVSGKIHLKYGWSLALVILVILLITGALVIFLGPSVSEQVQQMVDKLPESVSVFKENVTRSSIGRRLFNRLPEDPSKILQGNGKLIKRALGTFSTAVGAIGNLFLIIFIGIFLAAKPAYYFNGFIKLFPVSSRERVSAAFNRAHVYLSLWMLAKLVSMAVVAVLTIAGLYALGMPLPIALGVIAGLLSFIPTLGPYLALVPAVLIAFTKGADMALYVVLLYMAVQFVESYLITPYVQKRLAALPPALMLLFMLLMGMLTGILGLILAAPLLAGLMVLVKQLYVKSYLEKKPE